MVISTAFRLCSGSQQSLTLLAYIAAVCGAEFVHFMRYWSWMYLSPCPDHDAEAARPPSGADEEAGGAGTNAALQHLLQGSDRV